MIFFNQSNDYTEFFTFVINICENIITIIKFYLFVITRRKVLTVHITISLSLLVEAIGMTQGCLYQDRLTAAPALEGSFSQAMDQIKLTFY